MLTIAYSGRSKPSALKISEQGSVNLVRDSNVASDVNWGRARANAQLNPDTSKATNKRVMRELFAEHGVPMPKLYSPEEVRRSLYAGERKTFVGRPDTHTKGRGFWKVSTFLDWRKALRGTRRKKAATHFMEFVESDREYRVHIFKGKSIRISEKVFDENGGYTTGKPGDIKLAKVRNAARQAVQAVGLDFGAVDILARGPQNEEVFVLEVNSAPGLGGTMPKLYADTFAKWKNGEWQS